MNGLHAPVTQLSPLPRGNRDGITRLARRTQRGQGRRRFLVAALVAASVAVGTGAAVFAATMITSDRTVGITDEFGPAAARAISTQYDDGFPGGSIPLTADQQAWLDEHGLDGVAPGDGLSSTRDPYADLDAFQRAAIGYGQLTVDAGGVAASLDLPSDDVLVLRSNGMAQSYLPPDEPMVVATDITHPLVGATFDAGGATALTGDQALASPQMLTQLGAAVGDTVEVPRLGTVEVVGTVTRAYQRSQQLLVVAPDRDLSGWPTHETIVRFADEGDAGAFARAAEPAAAALRREVAAIDLPAALEAERMQGDGDFLPGIRTPEVVTRADYLGFAEEVTSLSAIVGGTVSSLATVVAAVVGACAFSVGVRRRIRELGMLGAIGASPRQIGRLLRREGLVIGLGGALVGAVLAIVLSVVGLPIAERVVDRDLALVVPVLGAALPVVVGALGAFLAAAWPARTAARVPVVTALAGRVPLGRVPAWMPVAGAVAAVAGVALLVDLITASGPTSDGLAALQLLAAVLLATLGTASLGVPIVAAGGRLADRLPLLGRLALRDAARQRTRSAAAVAALVPVLALPVLAGATITSENALYNVAGPVARTNPADPGPSRFATVAGPFTFGRTVPPAAAYVDGVTAALPGARVAADLVQLGRSDALEPAQAVLTTSGDDLDGGNWMYGSQLTLATPTLMAAIGLPADAVPADGALHLDGASWNRLPDGVDTLPVRSTGSVTAPDGGSVTDEQLFEGTTIGELDVVRREVATGQLELGLLVGPAAADRLGLTEVGLRRLLVLDRVPTYAEQNAVYNLEAGDGSWTNLAPTPPFWGSPLGLALIAAFAGLLAVAGVSTVAGMTSALAATESDGDVRKAVALGAPPSLRRRLHGLQAWWHTAIAAVLGTGLGLAIAWAFMRTRTTSFYDGEAGSEVLVQGSLVVPGWPLLLWVLLLPVLVGLVIAALMRSAPVGAPRRRMA